MTNIEIQTLDAVKSASRGISKYIACLHNADVIWEQRRYEIAKDVLVRLFMANAYCGDEDAQISASVEMADKLIAELRKQQSNGEI